MKRIVIGILSAVTAGTAALTLAAAPANAAEPCPPGEAQVQVQKVDYRDGRYGRDFREREHERQERLRRERMRRLWLMRHRAY